MIICAVFYVLLSPSAINKTDTGGKIIRKYPYFYICRKAEYLSEVLSDLNCVECRAFQHLIAGNENIQTAFVIAGDILTDTSDQYIIKFSCIYRHRIKF